MLERFYLGDYYDVRIIADMGMKRRDGVSCRLEGRRVWQCECKWQGLDVMVLVVILAISLDVCLAQSLNDAAAYLNNVEDEVMRVAAKATENFVKTCGMIILTYSTQLLIVLM